MTAPAFRIGVDENGLGARLGPLVVTAVLARVDERGERVLSRKPPNRMRLELADSKAVVSHGDVALGEAWARVLAGRALATPDEVFERLSLESRATLRSPCPSHVEHQCWSASREAFAADDERLDRIAGHISWWAERGIEIVAVKTTIVCTKHLNDGKRAGGNRFVSDLHAMERLVIELRRVAGSDVTAVCGKVGGMDDYSKFFGPLSYRLHSVIARGKKLSAYHFPGIGELRFERDADARDSLVMLASLVGKYVRELLMARVSGFYDAGDPELASVSGYNDPLTARFVSKTALARRERLVPADCFERLRDVK